MKYLAPTLVAMMLLPLTLLAQQTTKKNMDNAFFSIDKLEEELDASEKPWLPFLQGENVLAGLYYLKKGR